MNRLLPAAALAAALAAAAGCSTIFSGSTSASPRFAVPDPPLPEAADSADSAPAVVVVGRVRAAPGASGTALRTTDAATGRAAFLAGGDLALPPEALAARRLRKAAAARYPSAAVCDASLAPRDPSAVLVECWIEDFRLVRGADAWSFLFSGAVYRTPAGAPVEFAPFSVEVPVDADPGRPPSPAAVSSAVSAALQSLLPFP